MATRSAGKHDWAFPRRFSRRCGSAILLLNKIKSDVADVAEFGLRWQNCEEFLRRLGYRAKVTVSAE
jgi:hypothetical protein